MKPASNERSEALSNPFKLPRGERLRREVVAVFRAQRTAILRYLKTGVKFDRPARLHRVHRDRDLVQGRAGL